MDAREEALGVLSKIWQKLQALPHADPVELGAFFIILTFILVVLLMAVVPCVSCCCCCRRRRAMTKATDL